MTTILLPSVTIASKRVEPVANPCGMVDKAAQLAIAILGGSWQRRKVLVCDQRLIRCAQWWADDQAARQWWAHRTPEGETANESIRRFGFRLPDSYKAKGNEVQSLAWGYGDALVALEKLLDHAGHREHIRGDGGYARQNRIGCGYAPGIHGKFDHLWVVLIAEAR